MSLDVRAHPGRKSGFVEGSGGKGQHGARNVFFAGRQSEAAQFQKQRAQDKTRAFVSVDEGVIADNPRRVGVREVDESGRFP